MHALRPTRPGMRVHGLQTNRSHIPCCQTKASAPSDGGRRPRRSTAQYPRQQAARIPVDGQVAFPGHACADTPKHRGCMFRKWAARRPRCLAGHALAQCLSRRRRTFSAHTQCHQLRRPVRLRLPLTDARNLRNRGPAATRYPYKRSLSHGHAG